MDNNKLIERQAALEMLEQLFDGGSFLELCKEEEGAAVVCGFGTVGNRLVYAYAQYSSVNVRQARKLARLYEYALKMGAPIVGVLDSKGVEITEGVEVFEAYGMVYSAMARAEGVIPQISVIKGGCMGLSSFIAGLSDFVFMNNKGALFNESPLVYKDAVKALEKNSGSAAYHFEKTGLAGFVFDNEAGLKNGLHSLLSYLPSNNLDKLQDDCFDELNRINSELNAMSNIDMAAVIKAIADEGKCLEVNGGFEKALVTAFVKINGYTVGVIGSNGSLSAAAIKKCRRFVDFCGSFRLPIVSLVNVTDYESSQSNDYSIIMEGAELAKAFISTTVPKISVVLKNAFGSPYLLLGSRHVNADLVYAWENAQGGLIEAEKARKLLQTEVDCSVDSLARLGYVDEIIKPQETRKRIIAALEMLYSKRVKGGA